MRVVHALGRQREMASDFVRQDARQLALGSSRQIDDLAENTLRRDLDRDRRPAAHLADNLVQPPPGRCRVCVAIDPADRDAASPHDPAPLAGFDRQRVADNIAQVSPETKVQTLIDMLNEGDHHSLVFVRTRRGWSRTLLQP